MSKALQARVSKLEGRRLRLSGKVHRLIVPEDQSREDALRRYEQEAGLTVDPLDLVIFRVIVCPEGQAA